MRTTPERFEELVARALEELPEPFAGALHNIEVLIEDRPWPDDLRSTRVRPHCTLLGLYRGVPLSRRGGGYHLVTPDVIVIFREPIERLARDEADLEARVRRVVRHEIAHYFGISDERLREIGAY
ncbi:MAG TPA: metallopeptidase family protein [Dehalococcoidia bacterium]|nr:metallopeptidase family protein [Dehalococcoidia bacterium]